MTTTKTDAQTVLEALEFALNELRIIGFSELKPDMSDFGAMAKLNKALPAAQRLVDGEKWQSINTAPKDGIHYLGMIVGDRFYGEPFVCYYDEDEGHICLHQTEARLHRPTHWMHFPKPITSEEL
jgi:hypothetical protein